MRAVKASSIAWPATVCGVCDSNINETLCHTLTQGGAR